MTAAELARKLGVSPQSLQHWKAHMLKAGVAFRDDEGKIKFYITALDWWQNERLKLKDLGGYISRTKNLKSLIKSEYGLDEFDLFYEKVARPRGWYYRVKHFKLPVFLGKNLKEAEKNITYKSGD